MATVAPMPGGGIDVGRPGQQLLPGYVVKLLKTLKIPFGTDRSMGGVDVDPTVNLVTHIFDCIGALRDVNKVYRAKGSLVSRSVGTRVLFGFTAELGNILLDSITFDPPHDLLDSAVYYSQIANAILNVFPEISAQVTPSTGKVLLHHTALKTSSIMAIESLKMVLKAFPAGAWTADKSGALPLHWITHNANCTPEMINYLINANPKAPWVADADGYLPLHWAVNQDNPNIDVVAALVTANPSAASKACNKGSLPIHWCINRERPHLGVMRALVQVHPDGLRTFDKTGWLPLHQCVNRSEVSVEAVQALIELYPQALQCPNSNGQLPLHRALDQANPHIEAVHIMLQAFPGAAKVADDEGYLPLHLALDCARPNPQIAAMLLEHYPEAAFHKSKDGLLPMHCIISAMHPVVEIIQLLLQIFPDSSESMAVDLIPVEETADPETWQGEWIEKRWTPLSRAIDRGLDAIVMLFRDALGNKQPTPGQLPPRTTSAPTTRNFMPQSKPPIHNISHITNAVEGGMMNQMNNMSLVNNVTVEMQQPPVNGMVGPGPSTSSVEGSHHRQQQHPNALVLGGNLDSEDEPNQYRVPRDAMLQDSDNELNIRIANNSSTRMQMNRPVNNSTGNLMANVNGANPPPIKDRAPGGTRNPSLNPMMSSTLPANLADMKAKERERRSSGRDGGDRDRERSSRRSSSRRGGDRGERSSERRSSSRHRHSDDRDRGRDRHRDDEDEYYDEEDRHRSRHRSSSRRRDSSRDRSHDRHRSSHDRDRDRHREHRERERIYENTEYDEQDGAMLPSQGNLPINTAAQEDSSHLFQQPLANNTNIINKVRPASSNGGSVSRPSSLLEAASTRPNNIMQQPPGGYNRRGLSAGSARPMDEQTNNPNIIRSNQQGSRDLSESNGAYLDPNTPANLDEIV